jgi:hypothetical protein
MCILRNWEKIGSDDELQIEPVCREAQECTLTWSCGQKFVGRY